MSEPLTPDDLANLRHDLRTPFNHLLGYTEMLLEVAEEESLPDFLPGLQALHTESKALLDLLNEALAVGHEVGPAERRALGAVFTARLPGLEKVRTGAFDVVLLDILMPEVDGYEVLRQVKSDAALRDVPVIMISALDEIASVVRCIEMGAEDYLPKPFDPVLLRARIGACVEKKRLRDRERRKTEELEEALHRLKATQDQLVVQEKMASLGARTAGIAHAIKNTL